MIEASKINIKIPGRICLFGDHQDYLDLPVIACAFNLEVILTAEENAEDFFQISMPDIGEERIIAINKRFQPFEKGDYFASGLETLRARGITPSTGYNIKITSSVPINAGVSSSSAIVVAWIHFLLKAFGNGSEILSQQVAQMAYETEVVAHNSPGGRMDQYTIAIGDIIYIDTSSDAAYETIGKQLDGMVLGLSGVPKETLGLLATKRKMAEEAVSIIKEKHPDFKLKTASLDDSDTLTQFLPMTLIPYFRAAIKNHTITQQAYTALKTEPLNYEHLGELMNAHHDVLKNDLKLTVPLIDHMITAALEAGAYGAKIVGSGLGGSIVTLCPSSKTEAVINAIKKAGAIDAFPVQVTSGSTIL